jgi:alanyl-tRNA synthetase
MASKELRQKFLNFFEKKGHKIVPSSSLIPTDPSVLFTTAGMQQFKPYYLGEKSPYGSNVVSCQKCFRTSDIEEVGDENHLTFLEMLGNFSFGGYFKEEAIKLAYQFLFKELKMPLDNVIFTVFEGDKEVPEDKESVEIWRKLGVPENRIKKCGREDNFWGPTGEEGPCGPTTEIHIRGIEIWNLVFNEYYQDRNKKLTSLKQKGVDTGMGLERLAMIVQGEDSVYQTDLFEPIIKEIKNWELKIGNWKLSERSERIIADHIKSSVFLISEGIFPSNVERGYVLRRILRRAIRYGKLLNLPRNFLIPLAQKVIEIYKDIYPEVKSREVDILTIIQNEEEKFLRTLERGLKEFKLQIADCKLKKLKEIPGKIAFDLYQSYGFPLELTKEMAKEENLGIDEEGFEKEFERHQEISRAGAEKKFGGVGKEATYESAKLHTATHLLHAALREILGEHVKQMGSDITPQRLRFDFSHSQKMSQEEIRKVEDLVNQKIKEDLEVKKTEMSYQEALRSGALAFFKEKYPERVTVYTIGNFSKEICAGPHVERTGQLGHFKIIKEESSGAGVRRIRAVLE